MKQGYNANSICNGLDSLHRQCDNRHIRMDVESELLRSSLDVLILSSLDISAASLFGY
jgi:hypothetical protein